MDPLPRQIATLDFIKTTIADKGAPPSFAEIADAVGLKSKNGVHRIVTGLEDRGLIRRVPGRARAIEVVDPTENKGPLSFLSPDVRAVIESEANAAGMRPETIIAEVVRNWANLQSKRRNRSALSTWKAKRFGSAA